MLTNCPGVSEDGRFKEVCSRQKGYVQQTAFTMSHVTSVKCSVGRSVTPFRSVVRSSDRCAAGQSFDCSRDFFNSVDCEKLNTKTLD